MITLDFDDIKFLSFIELEFIFFKVRGDGFESFLSPLFDVYYPDVFLLACFYSILVYGLTPFASSFVYFYIN